MNNEENYYVKISKTELMNLLWANEKLSILENAGVDNWYGYMTNKIEYLADALGVTEEFIEENDIDIEDLVEKEIINYEKIS